MVGGIWTAFNAFTGIRDNFLSQELQKQLATPALLSHLTLKDYLIGLLVILFFALWNGGFDILDNGMRDHEQRCRKVLGELDNSLKEQQGQITALSAQLVRPKIVPDVIGGARLEKAQR